MQCATFNHIRVIFQHHPISLPTHIPLIVTMCPPDCNANKIIEHRELLLNSMYNGKWSTFGHMHCILSLRMIIDFIYQFWSYLTEIKIDQQPHKWADLSALHILLWRSSGVWETPFDTMHCFKQIWVYFP